MRQQETSAYSVLISLFIVGFLLVLTAGVFHLVLKELYDSRARWQYLSAISGAEGAMELALFQIKEYGYGYIDTIESGINSRSIMLSGSPFDISQFRWAKDLLISYQINTKTNHYLGTLWPLKYEIIPLFYEDSIINNTQSLDLVITSPNTSLAWNIVSTDAGLSGTGWFTTTSKGVLKTQASNTLSYAEQEIGQFLQHESQNYLIVFNSHPTDILSYDVSSTSYFSYPKGEIISSWQIGSVKQNLKTQIDNTAYLDFLKYSIFSK